MEKWITRSAGRQYCLTILEKNPKITWYSVMFLMIAVLYSVYVSVLYAHYDCEGWGYTLFAVLNAGAFFIFTRQESNSSSRLRVTSLVMLVLLVESMNLIGDQNEKTICDVTVCHANDALQENINVLIQSLKRQGDFCNRMSGERVRRKEEEFEDMYLYELNFIWSILCEFYDSILSTSGDNCMQSISADRVFSNYELKILKIFTGLVILVLVLTLIELVLEAVYPVVVVNGDGQFGPGETFFAEPKINENPLLEFYRRSSEYQKNTAVFLADDNLEFGQQQSTSHQQSQHHHHHHQSQQQELHPIVKMNNKLSFGNQQQYSVANQQIQPKSSQNQAKSTNPFDEDY